MYKHRHPTEGTEIPGMQVLVPSGNKEGQSLLETNGDYNWKSAIMPNYYVPWTAGNGVRGIQLTVGSHCKFLSKGIDQIKEEF